MCLSKKGPTGQNKTKKSQKSNIKTENHESSQQLQQQQHSIFSQASWGRLEMKPERNKFKVQAH